MLFGHASINIASLRDAWPRKNEMFIDHDTQPHPRYSGAKRICFVPRRICAPLERGSCSQSVSINIWLRWSQGNLPATLRGEFRSAFEKTSNFSRT